jgi:hypothetical protein
MKGKRNRIVHPSFRPLSRLDIGLFVGAIVLVVLGLLASRFAGERWAIVGLILVVAGVTVFLCAYCSRSWRLRNQL